MCDGADLCPTWILTNQYRILEQVHPDQASSHALAQKVLEGGYERLYSWIAGHICPDDEVTTHEEAGEVLDVLQMYDALGMGFQEASDKGGLQAEDVAFPGFDGNDEGKQFGFTRIFCNDLSRYTDLQRRAADFNSHFPVLDRYRAMLPVFKRLNVASGLLTINQIKEILGLAAPARRRGLTVADHLEHGAVR